MHDLLHCHSEFSMLDSPMSVYELVDEAVKRKCNAVALTDHGNMLGIPSFFSACKEAGIKAIAGVEAYVEESDEGRSHLVILAKDSKGYHALCKAVSKANARLYADKWGEYPRMNKQILMECFGPGSQGYHHVFILSACVSGVLCNILLTNYRIKKNVEKIAEAQKKLIDPKSSIRKRATKKTEALEERCSRLKGEIKAFEKMKADKKDLSAMRKELSELKDSLTKARHDLDKIEKKCVKYLQCEEKKNNLRAQYRNDLYRLALKEAEFYKEMGDFYIELQYHGLDTEDVCMPQLIRIAKELAIPVVATNDVHYATQQDSKVRDYLQSVRLKHWINDGCSELYIKEDEELRECLSRVAPPEIIDEAIQNTYRIAEQCTFVMEHHEHYPTYHGNDTLEDLIFRGIEERIRRNNLVWDEQHQRRLEYETKVISKMGYNDYFLNMAQIMTFARKIGNVPADRVADIPETTEDMLKFASQFPEGVGTGPGRGSAVGSLLSYIIGITQVDPIPYKLVFERFLNTERVTMPDIDSDFRPDIIPAVYRFLQNERGDMAVSKISTINRFQAKQAIRSAGMILKFKDPEKGYDKAAESLAVNNSEIPPRGRNPIEEEVLSVARCLEGRVKSRGIHAAGTIISDSNDISDYVPLCYNPDEKYWAVQCNMEEAEKAGLLKMDLLKLLTLKVCSETIQKSDRAVQWENIPIEKEVFSEIYCKGFMNGIFQCESEAMQGVIVEFAPDCMEDLILLIAAYRPGPMDYIPDMIAVKHGRKTPTYLDERLKPILSETYGSIVYQEQVMQIFQTLAGYSLGDADLVRRAMSKKKMEKLLIEKEAFIYGDEKRGIPGCINNGLCKDKAEKLFDEMTDFAKYAFNKSHAVAYAIVSYRTAFLKYHMPAQYLASYLNCKNDEIDKVVSDCQKLGIPIELPEVNLSSEYATVRDGGILLGFSQIRFMGGAGQEIIQEREKGPFLSRQDFIERTSIKRNIRNQLDAAGVFRNMDDYIPRSEKDEKSVFGAFVTTEYKNFLAGRFRSFDRNKPAKYIKTGGILLEVRTVMTKSGHEMAMLTIGLAEGTVKAVLFPDVYKLYAPLLVEGECRAVEGRYKNDGNSFVLDVKSVGVVSESMYYIQKSDYRPDLLHTFEGSTGAKLLMLCEDGTLEDTGKRYDPRIATMHNIKPVPQFK